jgi:rod shape determining protein RodA
MKLNKFILNFDYIIFFSSVILTVVGVLFIYSADLNKPDPGIRTEYLKQIIYFVVSLALLFVIILISPRMLKDFTVPLYAVCMILLLVTLLFPESHGQKRINLFGSQFQFSEIMKIATILLLSYYYSFKTKEKMQGIVTYMFGCIIAFFPVILILGQPDLGTSLVFIPILLVISYVAGVKKRYLLYTVLLIAFASFIPFITTVNSLYFNNENMIINLLMEKKYVLILLAVLALTMILPLLVYFNVIKGISARFRTFFYWYIFFCSLMVIGLSVSYPVNKILKPYQKDRLLIFINPYVDVKNRGYNIIQSMNTIGNGGFWGKGFTNGEQVHKFFLPEQATDFIYPVIAEEWGFVRGSLLILILYGLIFYRGIRTTMQARDQWSVFVVSGILSVLLFHIIENMGMCVGIMPITGIPLPFLSYGGSFLIACYTGIGIIMNTGMNKYQY